MSKVNSLATKMRQDWNRRVAFDYRFWMSEAHESDEAMWQSGERDLNILLAGLENIAADTAVEVGCGVGRLLKAAGRRFKHVIGIDISDEAISKANVLLGEQKNIALQVGNGYVLDLPDCSVELVYSFASLTSAPVRIWAHYLLEMNRVLFAGGRVRLQLYLGNPQQVCEADTLHLRCFKREAFEAAVRAAGFEIEFVKELVLPFEVSAKELGITACICSLVKTNLPSCESAENLARLLFPQGEPDDVAEPDMGLESWMSFNYAKKLVEWGDLERARGTLEYALGVAKADATDIRDLLERIADKFEDAPDTSAWEENFSVLQQCFPAVAKKLIDLDLAGIEIRGSAEGPVLYSNGQALDHPSAPVRGAQRWLEQNANLENGVAVFGFGGGYHLEQLVKLANKVVVWEPDARVLRVALGLRDFRGVLQALDSVQVGPDFELPEPLANKAELDLLIRPQTQALYPEEARNFCTIIRGTRALRKFRPSIGVLGPLMGGTLPMLDYVNRNLQQIGQRSRAIDMSAFAGAYGQIDAQFRNEGRKSGLRQQMMNYFSTYILQLLEERPVDIVLSMALAPITPEALQNLRRKGTITALWFVEDYLRFTYWAQHARSFDFVFTIQKEPCISAFKQAGFDSVHYLPCACDPAVHKPLELSVAEKERFGSDVSFVGAGYHNRRMMLLHLADLDFKIWGTEWPDGRPYDRLVQEGGRRLEVADYVKVFNASKINLNLHSSTERDGVDPGGDFVNPRTFELAAAGAFQLCDARAYLPECFVPDKEIVVFRNLAELRDQISYFLERPEERQAIAERARARALKEHSYERRIAEMLKIIYAAKYQQLRERHDSNSWFKMMDRLNKNSELYRRCRHGYEVGFDATLDALAHGIMLGEGDLTSTEQKLLFLFHIRKQMILLRDEEVAQSGRRV